MGKLYKNRTKRIIGQQEFEVKHNDDSLFQLPRANAERMKLLSTFVRRECEESWKKLPTNLATLKRQFLTELTNSIDLK